MLTRKTPTTLATQITFDSMGETVSMKITFHNRTQEQIQKCVDDALLTEQGKADPRWANREAVIYMVKDWESEYALNQADLAEMDQARPGVIDQIAFGYHKARQARETKN